jgi:hypothetical protein
MGNLSTKPIPVGKFEVSAQAQVGVGSDTSIAPNDLADSLSRDANLLG